MVDAPEKLLDRARRELHTYERVGKQTSSELILALFDAERQIAELRAEWARAHEADAKAFLAANARAEAAEAERDRLAAENAQFREALEPFAREADSGWLEPAYDGNPLFNDSHRISGNGRLTVGDLRRARAALDTAKGAER